METVVIANDGSSPVVMTGWTLRDRDAHVFRFPSFTLRADGRVTIHNGQGSNNAGNLYWDSDGYVWNNDGDGATLKRRNGSRVDACSYSGRDVLRRIACLVVLTFALTPGASVARAWSNGVDGYNSFGTHDWVLREAIRALGDDAAWVCVDRALRPAGAARGSEVSREISFGMSMSSA